MSDSTVVKVYCASVSLLSRCVFLPGFMIRVSVAFVFLYAVALTASGQTSVLTQHNDLARTGQNLDETILTTSNVNVNQFGKLFSLPVDGQVYAQPLYVPNVTINGGTHNVLIIATENDSVFAFDADSNTGANASPLWHVSLVDVAHGAGSGETPWTTAATPISSCTNVQPLIGITSTPVVDPSSGTIFVEATSTNGSSYFHRLHAIALATGAEESQGPVLVTATVSGTGDGSSGGQLTFDPLYQHQRSGLLLLNGVIYLAFGSHCDLSPYHGWLFAYDSATFTQESVFVTTPNGGLGGVWMAGSGIAADANGNIYIASGNGDFDTTNVPATEVGDTILKLGTTGAVLSLLDYFTPSDQACLDTGDKDLGSGGVLLLPDQPGTYPHILVEAGKEGQIYLVNRDQMTANNSHYNPGTPATSCSSTDPEILEETNAGAIGGMFSVPAYWNSTLYVWGASDVLKAIPLINGLPDFNSVTSGSTTMSWPGATLSISSDGTTAGTAILWAIDSSHYGSPGPGPGPAVLHAYDATNLSTELWNSTQAGGNRDQAGNAVKFSVPTIASGKVYIGTSTEVDVYGLLSPQTATPVINPAAGMYGSPLTVTITDETSGATIYYTTNGSAPTTSSTQYAGAFQLTSSGTVEAIAVASGYVSSTVASVAYTVGGAAATPTISPSSGSQSSPVTVMLTDSTPNATITYTTDGSTPVPGQHGTAVSSGASFSLSFTSTATVLAIASASGFSNSATASMTYTIQSTGGSTPSYSSGFTSTGLTLNNGAAISGTQLQVTDGGTFEARSAFFSTPVNVTSFTNAFTFQDTSAKADGLCFVIEASGPTALGGNGGSLGYAGATGTLSTNSLCVDFDLFNGSTNKEISNTGLFTNGASPANGAGSAAGSLSFQSGDVMSVQMTYNGTTLTMQITDTVTSATYSTSFTVNIPSVVGGNTAYVGFTGGTGGLTAIQDILTWTYTPTGGTPVAPTITAQPSNQTVTVGQTATFTVVASGTAPLSYQWLENTGSGFTDISGATSASYTTPATTSANSGTTFEVTVSNSQGPVTSNAATLTVTSSSTSPSYSSGFTSTGLTLNNGAAINGTRLRLTDGGTFEARSAFFSTPVNVTSFTNAFTFQDTSAKADGLCFVIEASGPTALGGNGGSLGYAGATGTLSTNSLCVDFDLFNGSTNKEISNTGLFTNGASPANGAGSAAGSLSFQSGDVMSVQMTYNGTTLTMQITDTVTSATYSTSFTVNIPSVVGGNTAYVGFTGGTGGLTAIQDILTWTYTPTGGTPVAPTITAQPSNQTVTVGQTATFTVVASGTAPLSYQWLENTGSGFTDISGATSASYTTPATTSANSGTTFEVTVSNSQGPVTSNAATLTVTSSSTSPSYSSGFTSTGLTLNNGAAINGTRLRLTDGGTFEARSAFFSTPVNVTSFTNAFTFQDTSAKADGLCFVIEASGPTALGGNGGSLGYAGTTGALSTKSLCVDFDLFNGSTNKEISNTGLFTNGASPANGAGSAAGSLSFQSGDVMSVQMTYNGTTLTMQITDTVTSATYSTSFTVNIPSVVGGNTAYVGFTGGTGGLTAIQDILTWTYTPTGGTPVAPTITAQPSNQTVTVGQTATFTVVASGTAPLSYQWLENTGSGFTDISGATSASYTTPATTSANSGTTFEVTVSNSQGPVTSNAATLTVTSSSTSPSYSSGFTSTGLTLNNGAAINGTRLRLTDGGTFEARSAFFSTPVNVTSFTNAFTFQDTSAKADGLCFVIEASGPTALGGNGGSLGYAGATGTLSTNSLCVDFDLFNGSTNKEISNTGLFTNGASPANGAGSAAGSLSFQSGDVMSVQMTYNGTTLTMQITDTVTSATYSTSFTVNIPSVVGGNTAYVGFTGGTGGLTATQDILTWTYAVQ